MNRIQDDASKGQLYL